MKNQEEKKIISRKDTIKEMSGYLDKYEKNTKYTVYDLASDIDDALNRLIDMFLNNNYYLFVRKNNITASQQNAYYKCHDVWQNGELNTSDRIKKSFKEFLKILKGRRVDIIGYSESEVDTLYKLAEYEKMCMDVVLKKIDGEKLVETIDYLQKIKAIDYWEAKKIRFNAYRREIAFILHVLHFNEGQIKYIFMRIRNLDTAKAVLDSIKKQTYTTWIDLLDIATKGSK